MNRNVLEKHLREHGCEFDHHGRKHDIWINRPLKLSTAVPRHRKLKRGTVRSICRALQVALPPGF
jgi:mRNA interferase HicA